MSEVISTINPFDDPAGAFQGKEKGYLPFGLDAEGGPLDGSGGAKPGRRGQARGGGVDPNTANFQLNWDPGGFRNVFGYSGGLAERAIETQGGAGQLRDQASAAGRRGTPQFDPAAANLALAQAQNRGIGQGNTAAQIAQRAAQTTGSGAQAVRNQGTDDAMNAALALAGSGGGLGGSAASLAQATQVAPGQIARAANDAELLQAQTDQADAARQLQALGMSGELMGAARGQDIQEGMARGDLASRQAQIGLEGMSLNDQMRLGLGHLGLGYENAGLDAQLGAGQLGLGAQQLGLEGAQADLEGRIAYERALNELYGIDSAQQLGMRELDIQKGQNAMGALGGVVGAVGGLAMMSDERTKKNERLKSLSDRYAAIGG